MKKRYYKQSIFIIVCVILMTSVFVEKTSGSVQLTDIKPSDWFYEDVINLVNKGVINGYNDNTFKPSGHITVAAFLKMALIESNQTILVPEQDIAWYSPYIETALRNDFIDQGYFTDYLRPITRGEMGNIIDRILKLRYNNSYEYIPMILDYDLIPEAQKASTVNVYIAGIITGYSNNTIGTQLNATRAEAATVIRRITTVSRRKPPELGVVSSGSDSDTSTSPSVTMAVTKSFSMDGIQTGMPKSYVLSHLGEPTEILASASGFDWYVYATDYTRFKLVGISNNKVVALYSDKSFESNYGIAIGTTDSKATKAMDLIEYGNYYYADVDQMHIQLFSEKGVADGVEAILITDAKYVQPKATSVQEQLEMEKQLFYLTNATRTSYNVPLLKWSTQARLASYKHSKDMALNGFFNHTNLQGVTFKTRMTNEGISASLFAENIGAGLQNAFDMHFALLHSDAHKINIINPDYDYAGMGIYYTDKSKYGYYVTQDFFKIR